MLWKKCLSACSLAPDCLLEAAVLTSQTPWAAFEAGMQLWWQSPWLGSVCFLLCIGCGQWPELEVPLYVTKFIGCWDLIKRHKSACASAVTCSSVCFCKKSECFTGRISHGECERIKSVKLYCEGRLSVLLPVTGGLRCCGYLKLTMLNSFTSCLRAWDKKFESWWAAWEVISPAHPTLPTGSRPWGCTGPFSGCCSCLLECTYILLWALVSDSAGLLNEPGHISWETWVDFCKSWNHWLGGNCNKPGTTRDAALLV